MNVEGFDGRAITCPLVRAQVLKHVPLDNQPDNQASHFRGLCLTTRDNENHVAGVLNESPHGVQGRQGGLRFTALGHHHAEAWAVLHVLCDVALYRR